MVTEERIGSPEAVVIYFASITYHLPKALPINHTLQSQPFCVSSRNEKDRCVTRQNGRMGRETNSLRAQPVIVSSRKAPTHKGVKEALGDKTKSCCTGLTCRHKKIVIGIVNTKSSHCYKSLLLII